MSKPACILGLLLAALCAVAQTADAESKGEALPERTVELVVDIDNRFIEDEFGGDAEAARIYVTNVVFAVRIILNQDLNITLSVKEIVVWENPAPFELDASENPSFTDVFTAYYEYVEENRADSLPAMFQLFTGYVTSFSGLRSLAFTSRPCDGVSALAAFASDTFPAGPGSIDVILSARGLGRNLGAATNTTEPSVMGATINSSTPLHFLPESIADIANRLAVGDCWVPVVVEGEGEEPVEICNDGIDNDENGFTDCDDFACSESEFCTGETSCGDGIDNDENGFTDCDDFVCAESPACTGETNCNDGIDNDENGFTDCDDLACTESPACAEGEGQSDGEGVVDGEGGETSCDDGIDNDENGFTDCDDFACSSSPVCTEGEGAVDGEGTADGEGDPQPEYQSADRDLDFVISLSELLRVVQLYNSQGLHCGDANSEDGYVPGMDNTALNCAPHTSDFDPQDWVIILGELLQLIQLYNADGYQPCEAPEAFCPVLL